MTYSYTGQACPCKRGAGQALGRHWAEVTKPYTRPSGGAVPMCSGENSLYYMSINCKKMITELSSQVTKNSQCCFKDWIANHLPNSEFRFPNTLYGLFGKWLRVLYPEDFQNAPSANNAARIRCLLALPQIFRETHHPA